jgi:hypothetical protein
MGGYLQTQTAAVAGRRPAALVGVLVAAALLMCVPALIAAMSIVDSSLPAAARDWASGLSAWLSYVDHARVVLYVPLLAIVAGARETQ